MTNEPFKLKTPMIAASILSADFGRLREDMDDVLAGGADFIHLDIMDGHYVPNISFGPPVVRGVRQHTRAYLDAHLMISEPLRYAPAMVKAGANNLTFHVETVDDPGLAARTIKALGCNVGITLNPATPVERLWPALDEVDVVLIMSVNPGFGGQSFIDSALRKIEQARRRIAQCGKDIRLEVDGGVKIDNIARIAAAGADTFVAGSAIFGQRDYGAVIAAMRAALKA